MYVKDATRLACLDS